MNPSGSSNAARPTPTLYLQVWPMIVEAIALTDDSYKKNPAIDIPQHMKDNYFLQLDIGQAATVYDKYWTMLMSEQ